RLRTGEIEFPRALELFAVRLTHAILDECEPLAPVRERARVVQPEILDVDDGHAGGREGVRGDFGDGGCISARKDPAADPGIQRAGHIAADEMQQAAATIGTNGAAKYVGHALEVMQA